MIWNRQRRVRVSMKDLQSFLARARRALRLSAGSLTVCLVTSAEIAKWNRAYRGKQGPTDVLSFPAEAGPPGSGARAARKPQSRRMTSKKPAPFASVTSRGSASSASYLGDVAIAPAIARRNARRFGRAFEDEMRILILHGMLHLMGYDHETDNGQMERRERRLRRALGLG